ncbi:MAG: DegT/DnrJ/EryC1/StrS aminotransferase family protein, partial [Sulfurovaceae bacterium]|nr:DegT/DnrJ/EryC1/StrS aminotransferase family protein [Sulfurovaceae bacterium]
MIIEKFVPPKIIKNKHGIDYLKNIHNNFQYASRGRWALYHCLLANKVNKGYILLPAFACKTILEPIKLLNLIPIFYDIDLEDLNPSIESINKLILKNEIKAAVIVSMYGNPANLREIEKLLKQNNILMIDDAAQAFGATLENRFIGTFGDSGFFSFSPGKTTVAHMGAFFWTKEAYTFNIK